jgi:mersacidin/lichenicidin family type 2 lantibiotic
MPKLNIIRAWKDEGYRLTLTDEERSQVPDSPAGAIDLSDTELDYVSGANTEYLLTVGCCSGFSAGTCTCTWGISCTCSATPEACNPGSTYCNSNIYCHR